MKQSNNNSDKLYNLDKSELHEMGKDLVCKFTGSKKYKIFPTAKEDKKSDLLVTNKTSNKKYKVIVKVTQLPPRKTPAGLGWPINLSNKKDQKQSNDLFYCFVHLEKKKNGFEFKFFVVPSKIVFKYLDNSYEHWKNEKKSRNKNNKVRIFTLGEKEEKYPVEFKTPLRHEYEDKWDLLT